MTLTDKIAATGIKPWCAGIESGDATGWPATDWIEDIMLRDAGSRRLRPVGHPRRSRSTTPGSSRRVDEVGAILKNEKYVNGGFGDVKTIVTTAFQEGGVPITDRQVRAAPPGVLLRQLVARRAPRWPRTATCSPSTSRPSTRPRASRSWAAASSSRPSPTVPRCRRPGLPGLRGVRQQPGEARRLGLGATRAWTSANAPNPIDKLSVEMLQDPDTVFRFDGSDLMPAAVGAGTFWKGMTDWINGKDTKTVARLHREPPGLSPDS